MGIKVSKYVPTSSIDTSGKTTVADIQEGESFQDVLVLNQSALKAMTIDAMVKQSSTGSVNPDAVDAAAIMKFRSTLGANIKAPIPTDDWDGGTPIKVHVPPAVPTIKNPGTSASTTPSGNTPVNADSVPAPILNEVVKGEINHIAGVPGSIANTGVLKCSDELNQYFQQASDTYGVDVNLLKCIAYAESTFRPNLTSSAGAMGVMQLMPSTAEGLGVRDAFDPEQNILGGAKYISIQLKRFNGDIELALAAYNAGPGNVQKYGGIPPFKETQNYVKKIMNIYNNL